MNRFIKIPLVLAIVTFLTSALLMVSEDLTHEKIAEQKKMLLLQSLKQLIPAELHDNDLIADAQTIHHPELLGHRKPQTLYIGKINNKISVLAIPATTPKGYSGDIDIMVGIKTNGEITVVKILEQHETPGLGDLIIANKSDWIQQFSNQSLHLTNLKNWKVERDGGVFDQISGATISPRAVTEAIKQTLLYHNGFMQNIGEET